MQNAVMSMRTKRRSWFGMGGGNWRFVRRDGKLLLVWQLTGYGELERRERESERRRQEDLFQSACMD